MQQLSLLETASPQTDDRVWRALDDQQRTLILNMLARLIARMITSQKAAASVEGNHE
jgi:hypothetical protein